MAPSQSLDLGPLCQPFKLRTHDSFSFKQRTDSAWQTFPITEIAFHEQGFKLLQFSPSKTAHYTVTYDHTHYSNFIYSIICYADYFSLDIELQIVGEPILATEGSGAKHLSLHKTHKRFKFMKIKMTIDLEDKATVETAFQRVNKAIQVGL